MPSSLYGSGVTAASAGGLALFSDGTTVNIYNPATNTWSSTTFSQQSLDLAAAAGGGKAFFGGGMWWNGGYNNIATVHIYDTATSTWSTGTLSQGREELVAASAGGKVLFAGGMTIVTNPTDPYQGQVYPSNVVDIYDTATGIWSTATLSQPRENLAATSCGSKIYFGGGYVTNSSVDIYDSSTGSWSMTYLSQGRANLAAASAGGKVVFAGGNAVNTFIVSNTVDIFDANTGVRTTATLSQARASLSSAAVGSKILFAGGNYQTPDPNIQGQMDGHSSNVVDLYDTATGMWSTASLSQASASVGATTVGNKVYLAQSATNTVDVYTLQNYAAITSSQAFILGDHTNVSGLMQLNSPGSLSLGSYNLTVGSMSGAAPINLGSGAIVVGNDNTSTTYSGMISGGGSLTKTGSGTLTLSASNTFTGNTRIVSGTLLLGDSNALAGSTLDLNAADAGTLSFDSQTRVNVGGIMGGRNLTLQNARGAGIALSAGANNQNTTYSGTLDGNGSLTKVGSGTLALTGTNAHTGGTTISGGELSISALASIGGPGAAIAFNGGQLQVTGTSVSNLNGNVVNWANFNGGFDIADANNTFTVSQSISGSGGLTKSGSGTLVLSGNNSYTGGTFFTGGTLRFVGSAAFPSGGIFTISNATFDANGGTLVAGAVAVINGTIQNGTISVSSITTTNGTISADLAGAGGLTQSGPGTTILSGSNTYCGGTTINGGELRRRDKIT